MVLYSLQMQNKFGPDFFVLETNGLRYSDVIIRDKVKAINAATLGTAVCETASVQYCNFNGDPTEILNTITMESTLE